MAQKAAKEPRDPKTVLEDVRRLAVEYYDMTGRPLGVTGELAEAAAAEKLSLKLAKARTAGYDATRKTGGRTLKVQIKGRRIAPGKSRYQGRVPKINLAQPFDEVVLVIFDERYKPLEIFRAPRTKVERRLKEPGSKARNKRGTLAISQFRSISDRVYPV